MPSDKSKKALIVLLGPTAVGKTELAIKLAEQIDMEIVSADSRLFYRGMDIGTAKPSPEELSLVAHHLIDVADPDETWSLAEFQRAAESCIDEIHQRGNYPLMVGGTGQYLRSITEGWLPPKMPPNNSLRSALENWAEEIGKEALHARLARLDSEAAINIDARNLRRTIRALEVTLSTGVPFSSQRGKGESMYNSLRIGLTRPRPDLYARIDARIDAMLKAGWLKEVQDLLVKGYSPDLPSMSAIGYQQLLRHLRGDMSLEEAITQIKKATRIFVRRQSNWFKPDDPNIHWFDIAEADPLPGIMTLVSDTFSEN